MEKIHLHDSELKLMELVWDNNGASAKELSLLAAKNIGWNKNTTYTILKKLAEKKIIRRQDPGFHCWALISKDQVCYSHSKALLDQLFDGRVPSLFSSFLSHGAVSPQELQQLRRLIDEYEERL